MKKISILTTLLLALVCSSFSQEYYTLNQIRYELHAGEINTATVYYANMNITGDVQIPEFIEYEGVRYTVTEINEWVFEYCSSLTSIVIPEGVTEIGYAAFYYCSSLESVELPSSLTIIGEWAFEYCSNLEIIISSAINPPAIMDNTFDDIDKSLISLYVPSESVDAYKSHEYWKGFDIRSKDEAAISLPLRITHNNIEYKLYTKDENTATVYRADESIAGDIQIPEFIEHEGISYAVTRIGYQAFSGCEFLTSLVIPEGVIKIGSNAFYYCSSLELVELPSSLTIIGEWTFEYCSNLEIIISSAINPPAIMYYNFYGIDESLVSLYVPNESVEAYKSHEYWKGFDIRSKDGATISLPLRITHNNIEYKLYTKDENTATVYRADKSIAGDIQIPEFIEYEGISYAVTRIGYQAFSGCEFLTSLIISEGVTEIGSDAFYYCSSLEFIELPSSLTTIDESAFDYCSNLEIIISSAINPPAITYYTFYGIDKSQILLYVPIESVDAYKSRAYWKGFDIRSKDGATISLPFRITQNNIEYKLYTGDENTATVYRADKSIAGDIQIPEFIEYEGISYAVTRIGYQAFSGCEFLTSLIISEGVTKIGSDAFSECVSLESVELPSSLTIIGKRAFEYCSSLTSIIIPEGVTEISEWTFSDCSSLESVELPSTLTTIDESAFEYCSNLEIIISSAVNPPAIINFRFYGIAKSFVSLYVPSESVDAYKSHEYWKGFNIRSKDEAVISLPLRITHNNIEYKLYTKDEKTATVYRADKSIAGDIQIPEFIEYEGISYAVTRISNQAFFGCEFLTSLVIPEGVTEIRSDAFSFCTSLEFVELPSSLTTIDESAFEYCKNLDYIISSAVNPPTIMYDTFGDMDKSLILLYVPHERVKSYKAHEYWKGFDIRSKDEAAISLRITQNNVEYKLYTGDENTATVYRADESIAGDIQIPEFIEYEGISYAVTQISNQAFPGCEFLTSLVIPEGIKEIGEDAFYYCTSLESLELPSSLTTINESAFELCYNLETIISSAVNPPTIIYDAFFGLDKYLITLYVPRESVKAYKAHEYWKEFNIRPIVGTLPTTSITKPLSNSLPEYTINVSGGMVHIDAPASATIAVYNAYGAAVNYKQPLAAGVYIVQINNDVQKVVVQ